MATPPLGPEFDPKCFQDQYGDWIDCRNPPHCARPTPKKEDTDRKATQVASELFRFSVTLWGHKYNFVFKLQ